MNIDFDLYKKSKTLIPDRTKDYEDYLRRKIATSNRAEIIKMEIDELDMKKQELMKEYDREIGLMSVEDELKGEDINKLTFALNTVLKIIDNDGSIGLDRIEEIATVQDISFSELKSAIPDSMGDKILKHHLHTVQGRSKYDSLI
jgi:hypothetical protein